MRLLLLILLAGIPGFRATSAETFAVLSLGDRGDAKTWASGFEKALKVTRGIEVRDPKPSLAKISEFFGRSDEWLFIAGHFTDHLYNEKENVHVHFLADGVRVETPEGTRLLRKGEGFRQDQKVRGIFWGGCSVHKEEARVKTLRTLFGTAPVSVGWVGVTGWEIVDLNLGGKGNGSTVQPTHFFTLMAGKADPARVRESWLGAADKILWGKDANGDPYRPRFSVIDATGQEWGLKGDVTPGQGPEKRRKF